MILEVFVLALACTVRPTSLAAVYALISRDTRRGLMLAYVIAGLAFTLAFGVIVVGATEGIHVHSGTNKTKAIADIGPDDSDERTAQAKGKRDQEELQARGGPETGDGGRPACATIAA